MGATISYFQREQVLNGDQEFRGEVRPATKVAAEINHTILRVMGPFISNEGKAIDYQGIKESTSFREYVVATRELQKVKGLETLPVDEQKAFWINLYNALTIHISIFVGIAKTLLDRLTRNHYGYVIGGHFFSCEDIEHGVLRGNQKPPYSLSFKFSSNDERMKFVLQLDPRIHFALVCGAKSCPPISVYTPENTERGLEAAAKNFCDENVELDLETKTLFLSKIFCWYKIDFGAKDEEVIKKVIGWLPDEKAKQIQSLLLAGGKMNIKFVAYDWTPNSNDYLDDVYGKEKEGEQKGKGKAKKKRTSSKKNKKNSSSSCELRGGGEREKEGDNEEGMDNGEEGGEEEEGEENVLVN
eukprot:TRINITY_DN3952_c0_g1_i2.p1 TRINITY_DN3952_c0_g1~~TRINITY_DN3952_c0_g1_i2.p1  ORF type:complete len:356 (-),score=100.53 TRINITY_DN3952_c0_g1_i2:112-1179(-)